MIQNIQPYALELKEARQSKRLSQRELASRMSIPQSHLSNIENGKVNLTLSNFIEMARLLDLEVMLIPKRHISLVESIVASTLAKGDEAVRRAYVPDDNEEEGNA